MGSVMTRRSVASTQRQWPGRLARMLSGALAGVLAAAVALGVAALPLPDPVGGGLDGYVFKSKSPGCGIRGIPHHAHGDGLEWLAGQTYLSPFPAGLRLRHQL